MTQPTHKSLVINRNYILVFFIAFCAAGWAGNYLKFSILNAHFIFGSIFAMLALQILGLTKGILAAAIISSYTYLMWNHPYAIVTMTAEVAVVGWLVTRKKINLTLADAIYWLLIGIPLGYFLFHIIGEHSSESSLFLMIKQGINGISNALISRMIFSLYLIRSKEYFISFREIMANLLVFFVFVTSLIMITLYGRSDLAEIDRHIRSSLLDHGQQLTSILDNWVNERKIPIVHLAQMATKLSPSDMQPYMDHLKESDINFLRISLIDKDGMAVAYSPLLDDLGRNNIGKNFSDRPYIPILKKTLKPMLSEVMVSKFGNQAPVAIMLAPVVINGEYAGAVGGILNLERIHTILNLNSHNPCSYYTLLDKNGKIILTNLKDQTPMSPLLRGNGKIQQLENGMLQWIPELPHHISTIELWGRSAYILESEIGDFSEWRLILEQHVVPFQKKLYEKYSSRIKMIFMILMIALPLADYLSYRVIHTIDQLSQQTRDLPRKLAENYQMSWPTSAILEINHLIENIKEMADTLTSMFREIRQVNEALEQRILERTEELRRNEEDYRRLFEDHSAVKLIINPENGNIIDANHAAAQYYGWSRDQLKQMKISQIDTLSEQEVKQEMERARKRERIRFEFRHRRADGSIRDVEVFSSSVQIKGGSYLHSIVHDITDLKQSEAENKKLQNQLLQAQKMESIGRLAGGVAHDFNNMLNVIIGYTEMALDTPQTPESVVRYLKEILSAALKSTNVVRQLLAFARQQTISPKVLDLNETVSGMLKMLKRLIGEDIDLLWVPSPNLWKVEMDPTQIDQILANLIVNARDAIPNIGKITIETANIQFDENYCKTHLGFIPGEFVMLAVSDNGKGMDKETMSKIFEPFFTTKELGKGTGLGLSTVYGIVKQNKGFINVYSEPGQGSTFKIYFPRCGSSEKAEKQLPPPENIQTGGETILLVEDEQVLLKMGKTMLERLGYNVLAASTPGEAIGLASKYGGIIHLLITDVIMPEMNGKELAERLREFYPNIKVLFMSGYTANVIAHHGVLEKNIHFIQKPFSKKELGEKTREVLKA